MNRRGIDKSVLLPMETPEYTSGYCLTEWAIEAGQRFPERLIPFINDEVVLNVDLADGRITVDWDPEF